MSTPATTTPAARATRGEHASQPLWHIPHLPKTSAVEPVGFAISHLWTASRQSARTCECGYISLPNPDSQAISQGAVAHRGVDVPTQSFPYGSGQPRLCLPPATESLVVELSTAVLSMAFSSVLHS
ncbi:uncharacterized protein PHALS_04692 [Plasmopara halstedii]|uniref:Uncharacterized protein n=1 Tax=Plasmopara halstedii TaxID=4781 RepID=A0A0N7L3Z5_PLAHL|nr:uncharacterized protein PHALS_04692 [Plasmopara halstedii]CEG37251.1 hypothetical protein PHALS_04692 [Plasmopara halstedii]|eukprot:XP_024573620.1 hypothetical protein PHALS_04692 [Plasmopara halstedii]